jgi:nucleotide-binding universal stress UspA family protein
MNRFKDILYFADGAAAECPALQRAVAVAGTNAARLTVLDVIPESPARAEIGRRLDIDLARSMREDREARLDGLIAPFRDAGVAITRRVAVGIAFVEVVRAVIRDGHDLVIKPARPPDSFVKRALGSTDLHLLRKCPCPIWIDREDAALPYRTVLAAVDVGETGNERSAQLIMDLASSLAEREGAALAVVHAWGLDGEDLLRSGALGVPPEEVDRVLDEARERYRARLGALLADYGMRTDDPGVHLIKGDPAPTVRELSNQIQADLIVMGTLGLGGVPGVFIGTTAEDLLQTTQASVLAIKPYDFVTPVAVD